jgi:hypothetical protein
MPTPRRGPKSEADLAVTIVKAEELTEEKRASMEREGKVGTMVVTEKQRDVLHRTHSRRGTPPRRSTRSCRCSGSTTSPRCGRQLDVRPRKGAPEPERTDPRYCLYDKPFKRYVFTAAFVWRCAEEVGTREVEGVLRLGAGARGQFSG